MSPIACSRFYNLLCAAIIGIPTIFLGALSSCSGESIVASRYLKTQLVRASVGGTVMLSAAESATYAGAQVVIPAGALTADTTITLAASDASVLASGSTGTAAGPVLEVGPAGLAFATPVTISIPFNEAAGATYRVGWLKSDGNTGSAAAVITALSGSSAANALATFTAQAFASFGVYASDDIDSCIQACIGGGPVGLCPSAYPTCYSDGSDYSCPCIAACYGVSVVPCAADGGTDAGTNSAPSCTSDADCAHICVDPDGQWEGGSCVFTSAGSPGFCRQVRLCGTSPCGPSDCAYPACLAACGVGCDAPGSTCYNDGNDYCNACTAACYGASQVACGSGLLICSTDADCPSGQSCTGSYCPANENICVSTCSEVSASDGGSDAGTCSSAADCASGQSCVAACDSSGSCGSACSTTGSSDGGVCDVQPCTGTGLNLEAFGSDGTCAFICQPDSAPCSSNSDCASGETCFTSPFGGSFCGTGSAALDGGTCSGPADCQGGEVCLYACVGGGCGNLCITQDGSPGAADGGVANNTGYADISVTATAVSASTGASRSICAQLTLQAVGIAPDGSQTPVGDPVTFVSAPSITAAIFGCIVGALDASGNNWGYQVTATSFSTCGSTSGTLGTPISDASPSTVTETVYMDCQLELDVPVDIPVQVSVP